MPADYAVGDPAAWPHTELAADAPPPAAYVRHIAQQLHSALEQQPLSGLARQADVTRSTIQDLLAGRVWPDLVTVIKLEVALNRRLWPPEPPEPGI